MKKNTKTKSNNKETPNVLTELLMLGASLSSVSPQSVAIVGRAFDEIERLREKITKLEAAKNARN